MDEFMKDVIREKIRQHEVDKLNSIPTHTPFEEKKKKFFQKEIDRLISLYKE